MKDLRGDCDIIVRGAIRRVMPGEAVRRALAGRDFGPGRLVLVSVGKAGWSMARAAWDCLGERVSGGIVITKHGHARGIAGLRDTAVFSVGSDGTDGPTDAAGGYVDGGTAEVLAGQGVDLFEVLSRNDAYHALTKCGGLIMTGGTGTNVNDVAVVLIRR